MFNSKTFVQCKILRYHFSTPLLPKSYIYARNLQGHHCHLPRATTTEGCGTGWGHVQIAQSVQLCIRELDTQTKPSKRLLIWKYTCSRSRKSQVASSKAANLFVYVPRLASNVERNNNKKVTLVALNRRHTRTAPCAVRWCELTQLHITWTLQILKDFEWQIHQTIAKRIINHTNKATQTV